MRPIKFRAFLKEDKTICDVVRIDLFAKCALVKLKNGRHKDFSFDDIKLMQFTGLYDKHGKEIYEGDVVRLRSDKKIAKVVFEKGKFLTKIGKSNYSLGNWETHAIEIIGNIHDNPELLEQ